MMYACSCMRRSFSVKTRISTCMGCQVLVSMLSSLPWRDAVARAEDESTGYILPNKTLLEIGKNEMPVTSSQLRRLMKSKHSYIERHLSSVVSIIRHSMQTSAAFEAAVQHLKERHMETKALQEETEVNNGSEAQSIHGGNGMNSNVAACHETSVQLEKGLLKQRSGVVELGRGGQGSSAKHHGENGEVNTGFSSYISDTSPTAKVAGATVQVLKKPSGAFGALLGGAAAKRKLDSGKKVKEEIKLEKIRSSVNLPFHSFMGINEPPKLAVEEPVAVSEISHPEESLDAPVTGSSLQDIIILDDDSDMEQNTHIAEPDGDDSKTTIVNGDGKSSGAAFGNR
ncbi:hypothetical protein OIU84_017690 [Salix udensis]|uniref:HRDC domain-containing protein n=1 Tax=Salix udensis TaxID=889485 RepID=A0AAD6L3L1_9ROSI|nr:hypothetical protein OIU84_017690 [Salix udensis]